jgi:membrane-associated protease RseP (regulator of RpoE activity)
VNIVFGLLAALLSFGFIICIHELGHYLAARWAGIRCSDFAIGFGPKLFGFRRWGTLFAVRAIPLGGYVLMEGEDPNSGQAGSWHETFTTATGPISFPTTPSQVLANLVTAEPDVVDFLHGLPPHKVYHHQQDLEGNFNAKTAWQRTVVILGGVVMNYGAALFLLIGVGLTSGLGSIVVDALPRAEKVLAESPAQRAGILPGDRLLKVNGNVVVSGEDFVAQMRHRLGEKVALTVQAAGGQTREVTLMPDLLLGSTVLRDRQGKLVVTESREKNAPQLPWTLEKVNGTPVTSLMQVKRAVQSGAAQSITLEGQGKKWTLSGPQDMRAVAGVQLALVKSLGFERRATSEIVAVAPGSPAQALGLKKGDLLVALQSADVSTGRTSIETSLKRLSQRKLEPGEVVKVLVERAQKPVELTTASVPPASLAAWGVELQPITASYVVRTSFWIVGKIVQTPIYLARDLYRDAAGTFKMLKDESQGPIGMMQIIFEVSDEGLAQVLFLVALLNAFVASFNTIPIPALDGARCLFIWAGALRGKAFDPEKEARIHFAGITVLLFLALLVGIQDIKRLIAGTPLMK